MPIVPRASTISETIQALNVYARYFPGDLPDRDAELAHRIDSLPRSAATVLKSYLEDHHRLEALKQAHAALRAGAGARVSVAEALRAAEAAGRTARPGGTTRNHPSQLHASLDAEPVSQPSTRGPRTLPRNLTTPSEIITWIKRQGSFTAKGQNGSHQQWEGPTGHKVTVPVHGDDRLAEGTLGSIRRQVAAALGDE